MMFDLLTFKHYNCMMFVLLINELAVGMKEPLTHQTNNNR